MTAKNSVTIRETVNTSNMTEKNEFDAKIVFLDLVHHL
jgi:hypothetical protein